MENNVGANANNSNDEADSEDEDDEALPKIGEYTVLPDGTKY
jgi:uncharacterized protein YhfF